MGIDRLEELTNFVFSVYYSRFDAAAWAEAEDDLQHMLDDDRLYAGDARVFAAIARSGVILSTGRAIEATNLLLPIERDFGVSVAHAAGERGARCGTNRVFEIARLATSSQAVRSEQIPVEAIPAITCAVVRQLVRVTSAEPGNFWVASMDVRALDLFRRRGFCFEDVGETDPSYIGSPTTPVILSMDDFEQRLWAMSPTNHAEYFGFDQANRSRKRQVQGPQSQLLSPSPNHGISSRRTASGAEIADGPRPLRRSPGRLLVA